jgi:Cys-rich repeat protein
VGPIRLLGASLLVLLVAVPVLGSEGCATGTNVSYTAPADASSGGDATSSGDAADAPSGCGSNADCAMSNAGHVCLDGSCVVCGTNADCPMGEKCNAHTSCVACLTSADCSAGERCVNNACAMGCDATSTCPAGMVCNTMTNVCVGCLSNADCTSDGGAASSGDSGSSADAGLPSTKCNTTTNSCVQCNVSGDCPIGDVCISNACVPGCSATQKCPTGSVCDLADAGAGGSGGCVGCLANSDCHVPTPWCDTTNDTCVQCTPSNSTCPAAHYCAGTTCVPGCNTNADCVTDAGVGAPDGGADGGAGGTLCDTQNHTCVQCVSDGDCALGQICTSNQCVAGCDVGHGCPSGSGCCTGMCLPLDTTSNCTACGVTCDTTSGNSQGAACTATGCTYTGCAAGWADCDTTPPDSNGCDTNLSTANEKVCSDGTCVPTGTCCTASDCASPPAPAACYPAEGTCVEGQPCQYPENFGSVVCSGICCNAINGSCNSNCSLDCNTGYAHCTGDPSHGCETDTNTDTSDCGDCARPCSTSETAALSCSSGVCNSTCEPGWGNCNFPGAPAADDGCESNLTTCVGTPCCGTACTVPHKNGEGESYTDCTDPTGVPGNSATYNENMAILAAEAYTAGQLQQGPCGSDEVIAYVTSTTCVIWDYDGTYAGYVALSPAADCYCPNPNNATAKLYTTTWD